MTDQLDTQLPELTRYQGEETALWKRALDTSFANHSWWSRLGARSLARPAMAACITLVVGVVMVAMVLPSLGHARRSARQLKDSTQLRGITQSLSLGYDSEAAAKPAGAPVAQAPPDVVGGLVSGFVDFDRADAAKNQVLIKGRPANTPADRYVVRKATIDLVSDDVRGTFAKAAHLVSEAQSEYVESSSLSGTGKDTQATLTLRITADRLGTVLTALRDLGTVKSENTTGEDVTGQVVDLDARIRNEQKIEQELLQLLDKRADAPLKDVLELRSSLSNIRESIERLIGQRDRLSRLVSLASILVTIRAPDQPAKPPEEPRPSIASYFTRNIAASWRTGLEYLSDTLSGAVALVIGGLVWWLLLALAVMAILRYRTRAIMRGA